MARWHGALAGSGLDTPILNQMPPMRLTDSGLNTPILNQLLPINLTGTPGVHTAGFRAPPIPPELNVPLRVDSRPLVTMTLCKAARLSPRSHAPRTG